MKTILTFKLNNEPIKISANSVECKSSCVQIELVKMLVECRAESFMGQCPLPILFNKYLRFMDITNIEFITLEEPSFAKKDDTFAEQVIRRIAA
mgnify:CR=1 FL=1|jgi:hypothetical protein